MDATEFSKDFMESVKSEATITGEGKCAVFVENMAKYLIEVEVFPDFSSSFFIGTSKGNRKYRVDGYILDEFDMSMNLIIADFGDDTERVLGKANISQNVGRITFFVNQALHGQLHSTIEPSTPCADLVDLLRTSSSSIRKYRMHIFTDANISAAIKNIDVEDIDGVPVECQIWSLERLFRICCSDLGRQSIEINFSEYIEAGIPCLQASEATTSEYSSYLCVIPGKVLADIYDQYGSALLEGNVRSFLSTKVAVNKKIRETIIRFPGMFFAYNNGISATAMGVQVEDRPNGRNIVSAKDFQIINGGQTTASLSNTRHKDRASLENIFVQMKLTEIDDSEPDKSSELIRNISRSSNSQNKVSDADFFATAPFHVRMEQYSRRLYAIATQGAQYETHWFYERARGQYLQAQMRMTPAKRKQFLLQNPKEQLITKTDLAKVQNTWRGMPHIVSKGAQTNFLKFAELVDEAWQEDDSRFNEQYFEESVALTILSRHLEQMIPKQPWYEQGYRANVITYTLAAFHALLAKQRSEYYLDLLGIWSKQLVPDVLSNVLLEISEIIYGFITSEKRKVVNVTQWCKREECWKDVRENIRYHLPEAINLFLISKEDRKSTERNARKERKFDSGIDAQSKVLLHDAAFWQRLVAFANERKLLSDQVNSALRYAVKIPEALPSASQSAKLLELLDNALSEGFKE